MNATKPIPNKESRFTERACHYFAKFRVQPWRRKKLTKETIRTVIALMGFTLLFCWMGGVGNLSIHRPFDYSGDSIEVLSLQAKSYIANDYETRMRAPFEATKKDGARYAYNVLFQSNSNLMWVAKLIGGDGPVKALNLAYLFSFLLVFLSAYWVCRAIGLRDPFGFFAASLYALMPYHFQRSENHFVESCYYFTPFLALVLLKLWAARPLGFRWAGEAWQLTWRDGRIWLALALLTFLTPFSPYHQLFFACLAALTAPFAAVYRKNWRPLLIGWALAVFACAVLVVKHALAHYISAPELALGVNNQPIGGYGGAEVFPLKLTQLLLPVQDHRWNVLAAFRHMYDKSNPLNNENSTTTLGFIGAIGLLSCVALALAPVSHLRSSRVGKMGLVVLMAILFASMGGLSSLLSSISAVVLGPHAMLTQARGWNRIVVFIGFFAYFASFWLLQQCAKTMAPRLFSDWKKTTLIWLGGAAIFAFALWDQVPYTVAQQHAGHYRSDLKFFGSLEDKLPPNSRVFQLPFVIHHDSGWVRPGVYYTEQLRPYVNTRTLHFTYGGDRMSVQAEWLRAASALPAKQAARYLCRYSFAGVLVQRNMLADPAKLEEQWQVALGEEPQVSNDRDYSFFALGAFCQAHGIQSIDMAPFNEQLLQQLKQGHQFLPGGSFAHRVGEVLLRPDGKIAIRASSGTTGFMAYGPYANLKPGHYRAIFDFSSVSNEREQGKLTVDVAARTLGKHRTLGSMTFRLPSGSVVVHKSLDFTVGEDDAGVEYRAYKTGGIGVDFLGVEIQKLLD